MNEDCDKVSIHQAAAEGRGELLEEILARGEDVNRQDQLGWTPLMHAAHNGHSDLVKELMSRGADVSICNYHGVTAFTIATLKFEEALQKMLYDRLMPELKQQEINTSLLVACANGLYQAANWLLHSTLAQVNQVSPLNGVTPLMLVAMSSGNSELAELLLKSGADINITNPLGQDVSELALAAGSGELFMLLNPTTPTLKSHFIFEKVEDTDIESIDPIFTTNRLYLDVKEDIVLKNSPSQPVFKSDDSHAAKIDDKYLLSSSTRSVFLLSPQQRSPSWDGGGLNCQYNLAAIVTPRMFVAKTPNKGKKRKLSSVNGISSWFKKITKRRSKSLADEDDYDDLNIQQQKGGDFLKLLKGLGLEEFFPVFKEQELDIWTFLSLTVQDLAAMGIDKASSQIRILAGIQTLRTTQI